jgi:hypothetical protein
MNEKSTNPTTQRTLTDAEIATERKLPRRSFLTATGVALAGVAGIVTGARAAVQQDDPARPQDPKPSDQPRPEDRPKSDDPDKPSDRERSEERRREEERRRKEGDRPKPDDKPKNTDPDPRR